MVPVLLGYVEDDLLLIVKKMLFASSAVENVHELQGNRHKTKQKFQRSSILL